MSRLNLKDGPVLMVFVLYFNCQTNAQYTQTIRGTVKDPNSQLSIPGANVIVMDTSIISGTITDSDGVFKIHNIPVGRYDIRISFIGYETTVIPSVFVTSGKEVILDAEITESVTELKEIKVIARSKDRPLNNMATLSARTFSVEETRRYAGGLDDPGRLVSVFAGVSDGTLESNGIVVRGNAPFGISYRIEGIEVDNPNHFAGEDFLGGGFVSVLSNHVLGNSDFLTGAFPAEYGNALSAVFDMNIRTGNTEKKEHTFQAGLLGIDFSSEGPLVKTGKTSYLFNYRYSTFGLIGQIMPRSEGLPAYQDLSFKLNFPSRAGIFSLWGTGGLDRYRMGNEKSNEGGTIIDDKSGTGVVGLGHKIVLNNRSAYIHTSCIINASMKSNVLKRKWTDSEYYWDENMENSCGRYSISSFLNKKISSQLVYRTGIVITNLFYDIENKKSPGIPEPLTRFIYGKGSSNLLQVFLQSKYNFSQKLTLNAGIHLQYFSLNKSFAQEPRAGIQWALNNRNRITFAFGKHSQIQMLNIYFVEKEIQNEIIYPNKNLGFIKADHYIAGYDLKIGKNSRIKIEPYYQRIYNVPVEKNTAFSILNLVDLNTFDKTLENKGKGRNIGIDLTCERFLSGGYYYLFTASVFDSKFKGEDGKKRNTVYNKHIISNILAGREWNIKKNGLLSINGRLYINGGNWISPCDYNNTENYPSALFTLKQPLFCRFDLGMNYTANKRKYNTVWSVQILNALFSKIPYDQRFNESENEFADVYGRMVLPSISWKVEF